MEGHAHCSARNTSSRFSRDLATVRVASIITGYKARGRAASLLDAIQLCRAEAAAKLPPLALIDRASARFLTASCRNRRPDEEGINYGWQAKGGKGILLCVEGYCFV